MYPPDANIRLNSVSLSMTTSWVVFRSWVLSKPLSFRATLGSGRETLHPSWMLVPLQPVTFCISLLM